ncbi:unnamed protein product [Haemonchus placei]|uniref:NR LBD domain-containing protein n=1 Tax=Haemonchus placei TaxID=6290 RepID=A0A0N4W247_HAEPC|nr:unnamed protein product [Haemonchus placei]
MGSSRPLTLQRAAQFTDTTLSIDAANELNVQRYVSDSAFIEGEIIFLCRTRHVPHLPDAERDEYGLAGRDFSDWTRDTAAIMFDVRPPAIFIVTTSALLISLAADGVSREWMDQFTLIISDETFQIPEQALVGHSYPYP